MQNKNFISKNKMHGATIMEVMISVFLLTFGILALMLAQVRSVAGIGEAENRTLIAQAAEALAEGMQANPDLEMNADNRVVTIRYTTYVNRTNGAAIPANDVFKKLDEDSRLDKAGLVDFHLNNFHAALNQIPDISDIRYQICPGAENPAEPIAINNLNCEEQGAEPGAVIKVVWLMKNSGSSNSNDMTTHTYMLKVKG